MRLAGRGRRIAGLDILVGNPFGQSLPEDQVTTVQNYFAEYHLEYFRQRLYQQFPSRLHALLLFATRVDAETFRATHPARVFGKTLVPRAAKAPTSARFTTRAGSTTWLTA